MISTVKRIETPAPVEKAVAPKAPVKKTKAPVAKKMTVTQVAKAAKTTKAVAKTLIQSVKNLKKGKVSKPIALTLPKKAPLLKRTISPTGTPRFNDKAPKKPAVLKRDLEAQKPPSKQKNPKLNVAEIVSLIKDGKTSTAINTLKEYQCTSPEGCGFVIFHDGRCFNHYHVKMKYGRDKRVNTKHTGELCSVCKKRPATNRDKCLPCYARIKYHADKDQKVVTAKKTVKDLIKKTFKKGN